MARLSFVLVLVFNEVDGNALANRWSLLSISCFVACVISYVLSICNADWNHNTAIRVVFLDGMGREAYQSCNPSQFRAGDRLIRWVIEKGKEEHMEKFDDVVKFDCSQVIHADNQENSFVVVNYGIPEIDCNNGCARCIGECKIF